jgi:prepilin-type N-terminal cleavage/methylation domain-containing protein
MFLCHFARSFRSKRAFAPLEKVADFSRRLSSDKADGGLRHQSAQTVRGLRSLTGFTFIEILMALVIMSASLIPIMIWIPTSVTTKLVAEQKTKAIFLAEGLMEQLRYQVINNFTTSRTATSQAFSTPFSGFYYNITDNGDASLKAITVSVWHSEKPSNVVTFYAQIARRY